MAVLRCPLTRRPGAVDGYNTLPPSLDPPYLMTPKRFHRLRTVLEQRQPDLTVVLDNVHKPHNLSAIVRSCDAVGVFEAHAVWADSKLRIARLTSGGAGKWVGIRTHRDIQSAAAVLRKSGHQLVAAHPGPQSVDYLQLDYTGPVAFLLGAELQGLGAASLGLADRLVRIPMAGHVGSLNVSVAAALLLFEARRQRAKAGLYDGCRLDQTAYQRTLFEWSHPQVADYCQRHSKNYPPLDENGDFVGDDWR